MEMIGFSLLAALGGMDNRPFVGGIGRRIAISSLALLASFTY